MLRSPPRSPPGTIPLSIPKAGDRQHPRSAPIPPPHSVWDYRWTSGACQEAERAGDSSFGPSPPHSLQTQAVGRTLAPALGTPQPAAGPASPMTERDGSHLVRGRRCYGDPQTKPSSCLQAEAPPWTKPCEHLPGAPSSGPRWPPQPRYRGPSAPAVTKEPHSAGAGFSPFLSSRHKAALAHTHSHGALSGQCRGAVLGHPPEQHLSPVQASRAGGRSCSAPQHRVSICHPIAPVQAGPTGARISAGR